MFGMMRNEGFCERCGCDVGQEEGFLGIGEYETGSGWLCDDCYTQTADEMDLGPEERED